MESRTKNSKGREQIAALVAKAFGPVGLAAGEAAVRELKDGWFNAAYALVLADGREVILKIAPHADAEVMRYERDLMATEVAMMRLAAGNPRIPVPKIYFYDESRAICDASYFFMEKVGGDNLEHVHARLEPQLLARLEREIGQIIREVNRFEGPWFGYPGHPGLRAAAWKDAFFKILQAVMDDAQSKAVVFEYSPEQIWAAIHRHLDALDEVRTPHLVHWDGWNPNFFVKEGRISGIIDFERALWADPLMEAQFRPLSWAGVTEAMRGYGKTEFSTDEMRRCWLYTLHLGLVMHVECYFRHYGSYEVLVTSRGLIASAMGWLTAH